MGQVRWDAHAYESVANPQLQWGRRLLNARTWRGDEAVLDAGCGPGTLADEILAKVPRGRLTAIDHDPSMVARATERLAKHGGRATVVHGDIQHLAIPDHFDVIFSNAVLHWVPDHDAVFETFLKHLRPGGELLAQCGGEGNLRRIRDLAADVTHSPEFEAAFRGWTPSWHYEDDASTQERLLIAGFTHPRVALEPAPTAFPDPVTFRRFAETVVLLPYLQRIAAPERERAFVEAFMQRVGSRKEDLVFDYVRLNIRAERSPHH